MTYVRRNEHIKNCRRVEVDAVKTVTRPVDDLETLTLLDGHVDKQRPVGQPTERLLIKLAIIIVSNFITRTEGRVIKLLTTF